jgi:hypothetical protein
MAETKNLKLYLWSGTDFPNYGTPNANYNKIDTAYGTISAQVTENTSDIETINSNVNTINDKLVTYDNQIKDLYVADATLVKKITKNETDIENNKTDISVLKNRVTKVENDSNLLRYYQIADSGLLTYQTKKQKKYRAAATLTKNAGTDNNNFAIDSVTIADRKVINNIHGDIYVNIPKSEIANYDSDFKINIISSLFSSNVIIDAPYGLFFAESTSDDSNYKLHFIFDSTYLSQFELSIGTDTMNVEFYFEILQ